MIYYRVCSLLHVTTVQWSQCPFPPLCSMPLLPSWVSAPPPLLGQCPSSPLGPVPLLPSWVSAPPPLLGQCPSSPLGSVPLLPSWVSAPPPFLGQCPSSPSWVSAPPPPLFVQCPSSLLGNEAKFVAKKLQCTFPFNLCQIQYFLFCQCKWHSQYAGCSNRAYTGLARCVYMLTKFMPFIMYVVTCTNRKQLG